MEKLTQAIGEAHLLSTGAVVFGILLAIDVVIIGQVSMKPVATAIAIPIVIFLLSFFFFLNVMKEIILV